MNKLIIFFRESQVARFLIPMGIILITFGIVMFLINIKNQNYIKTEAIVTRTELVEDAHTDADGTIIAATYKVYVKYTVDNFEYENELGELSGYKEGKKVTIYYNPENPNEITESKSLILPIIIIISGLAAFIGGIVSGNNAIKKLKAMKEKEKGWNNE